MNFRNRVIVLAFLVCFCLFAFNSNADTLKNVIMPNACLMGEANLQKINQSLIFKAIKQNKELFPKISPDEFNSILAKYGLTVQDFSKVVFGIEIRDGGKTQKSQAPETVFGIGMSKSVSIDNLKNIILDVLKKQNEKVEIKIQERESIKFLQIREIKSNSVVALIPLQKEKMIIGGIPDSAIAAVKRVKSGNNVALHVF